MDHASINYNNTDQIKYYNWNRTFTVSTKLLPFKNSNGIHGRQGYDSKTTGFQSL